MYILVESFNPFTSSDMPLFVPPSEMAQEIEEVHPPAVEALNIDDTSLEIVLNLVGLHLSCRDLIRLQLVSKRWQKWCSETAPFLWKARKRENVPDWYFPTGLVLDETTLFSPRLWYGIHHPSEMGHRLPGLEFLDLGRNWRVEVLTGAGGLLLLCAVCERKWKMNVGGYKMFETEIKRRSAKDTVASKRLIVCNPLTKRWRALSGMDDSIPVELEHLFRALLRFVNKPENEGVRHPIKDAIDLVAIHIVVNDASTNYEIVIIWETRCTSNNYLVEVYDSGMDQWEAITSPKHSKFTLGSVCFNCRIYLLLYNDQQPIAKIVAKVFLLGSRTWRTDDYTLFEGDMYNAYYGRPRSSRGLGPTLVACSGDIYAIVPVEEDFDINHGNGHRRGWGIRRNLDMYYEGIVRFDLFKLQEEEKQFAFCQALPFKVRMMFSRFQVRWNNINNYPLTWYRCASKGSVIWLACGDLLVQFDVVTGRCKTRALQFNAFTGFETVGENFMPIMPYEPSFCAEP